MACSDLCLMWFMLCLKIRRLKKWVNMKMGINCSKNCSSATYSNKTLQNTVMGNEINQH